MTTEREARAAETIPAPAEEGWVRRGMLGVFPNVVVSQPTAETIALKGSKGVVTVSSGYYVEAYDSIPVEEIYHHAVARCDRPVINPAHAEEPDAYELRFGTGPKCDVGCCPDATWAQTCKDVKGHLGAHRSPNGHIWETASAPAEEETWRRHGSGGWILEPAGKAGSAGSLFAYASGTGFWRVALCMQRTLAEGQAPDLAQAQRLAEVAYRAYKTSTASAPAAPPAAQTSSPREASTTGALLPPCSALHVTEAELARAIFEEATDLAAHDAVELMHPWGTSASCGDCGITCDPCDKHVLDLARVRRTMWTRTKPTERAEAEAMAQRLIARMR